MPKFASQEEEWRAYLNGTHPSIRFGQRTFRHVLPHLAASSAFVGFVGSVLEGDQVRVLRPTDVRVVQGGGEAGTVIRRVVPHERLVAPRQGLRQGSHVLDRHHRVGTG